MSDAALITGAAKRVGKVIALTLAKAGFDIALHYSSSADEARQTAEEIRGLGRRCELFQADFFNPVDIGRLAADVAQAFPQWRLLVNNASIFNRIGFLETTEQEYIRNFDVHMKTPFFLAQEFARRCKQGHIINILDTKIAKPNVNFFAYTLSKKCLAAFTEMAAVALAPAIRVNGVCPGMTLAPEGSPPDHLEKLSEKLVPLRHKGDPQQVADAILYLVQHDYVTGQILYADGGEHLM